MEHTKLALMPLLPTLCVCQNVDCCRKKINLTLCSILQCKVNGQRLFRMDLFNGHEIVITTLTRRQSVLFMDSFRTNNAPLISNPIYTWYVESDNSVKSVHSIHRFALLLQFKLKCYMYNLVHIGLISIRDQLMTFLTKRTNKIHRHAFFC